MEIFKNKNPLISIIKGTLISFLVTIITLTIFSVLLVYTDLSEDTIKPVIITVTGISILMGSSIETRNLRRNGLITGGGIGAIYILVIFCISSIMNSSFLLSLNSVIMICVGIVGGILGGIIGVNKK